MQKETTGTVVAAKKQWWLKVNTKPVRTHALDGAVFPYIIKVTYTADGREFTKGKWIHAGRPVPPVGSSVKVVYDDEKIGRAHV